MKLRNREINIFSMSALDLFASGMGAFILLAVISLPFFGNTSRDVVSQPKACPKPTPEKVCPEPVPPKPIPAKDCPISEPAGFKKMDQLDLVIVLDITGSMGDSVLSLKSEIDDIAALIGRLSETATVRVVAFGDENFDAPVTSFPLTPVAKVNELKRHLEKIKLNVGVGSGSNDSDGEAVYAGFLEAMNTSWSATAKQKVVVIITDDYPHGGEDGELSDSVIDFVAQDKNNQVSVRYLKKDKKERAYYQQLAKLGNGSYLDNSNGSLTASLLLALLPK